MFTVCFGWKMLHSSTIMMQIMILLSSLTRTSLVKHNQKMTQYFMKQCSEAQYVHSKTCRKKNTVCRFNFPRPPSSHTFITRQSHADELKGKDGDDTANAIMKVKTALNSDVNFDSVDAFFSSIGINQTIFEKAYNKCSKKKSI